MSNVSQLSWLSIGCMAVLQATSGTHSVVSAYSLIDLEHRFRISQVQLNYLVAALDVGRLFGWVSCLAADHLPMWTVLSIGLTLNLVGYGLQYLNLIHNLAFLSYWVVFLLNVIAGNGVCWINTYCQLVAAENFRGNDPKTVIALTSCYSSLGGMIYASLARGFTGHDDDSTDQNSTSIYLLLSCIVPAIVGLAVAVLLGHLPKPTRFRGPTIFPTAFAIAIATGAYAWVESVAPPFKYMSSKLRTVILVLVIVVPFAATPAIHASFLKLKNWRRSPDSDSDSNSLKGDQPMGLQLGDQIQIQDEHGVKELLMNLNFWVYFVVSGCGVTLGSVYTKSLGRISESRCKHEVSSLQVLSSLSGYYGRVFSPIFYWNRRVRKLLPRPAVIGLLMIPMSASLFLLAISHDNTCLYMTTAVLGATSGAIIAISASATAELFGVENAAVNHNIVLINIPVASLLFGHLAALNYDRERGTNIHGKCLGFNCHRKTFIVWGLVCSVGAILSFVLHLRTRKVHS